MKKYDIVIIGAGPARLTAGIYAARSGLKTCIISKDIGGTANSILLLENWPGFNGPGTKLMKQFYDHLRNYEVDLIISDVEKIEKKGEGFIIECKKEPIQCDAVIIATGTKRKKLNIPREKEFNGKGVSYCVTCDGSVVSFIHESGISVSFMKYVPGIKSQIHVYGGHI